MAVHVFVSHASQDKSRIRPLVRALALEGVSLWLDRPGHGENHFGFDQDFIDRHNIRGIRPGQNWPQEVLEAVRECGAVLGCVSRELAADRQVWVQELAVAQAYKKLVACVVDDITFEELPSDLGLIDASRLQAIRVDCNAIDAVLQWLHGSTSRTAFALPAEHQGPWQVLQNVIARIREVLATQGHHASTPEQRRAVLAELARVPLGPAVRAHEIPREVFNSFSECIGTPERALSHLDVAMELRAQVNPEGWAPDQMLVRRADVPDPSRGVGAYWQEVLRLSGRRSRRTLAAILMAPGAPRGSAKLEQFAEVLRSPPAGLST